MPDRAVVLLSGGIDSATALALAKDEGFDLYALTVDYGQRHRIEIQAAERLASAASVKEHRIIHIDLKSFGGSALTGDTEVPKPESVDRVGRGIPPTYVPARNTVFLSLALAWAEAIGATDIFIGVTAVDYSGYPDCRPQYIDAFQKVVDLGTKAGVSGKKIRIRAPFVNSPKSEIIARGLRLGVDYSLTHSCYDPSENGKPCGKCDSCLLRKRAFSQAGVKDPAPYPE